MDHTHSQLQFAGLYDAYNELLRATKDDPATHDKVKALAHYIPQRAPRDRIRTVVDNSAPNSAGFDSSIVDYIRDKNGCGNGWSASTDVAARLQALRKHDVPKDEVDVAKNHDAGTNSEPAERDEKEIAANYEAWTQLLDLMRQAGSGQAINLGQALAPVRTPRIQWVYGLALRRARISSFLIRPLQNCLELVQSPFSLPQPSIFRIARALP